MALEHPHSPPQRWLEQLPTWLVIQQLEKELHQQIKEINPITYIENKINSQTEKMQHSHGSGPLVN